ncbi:MAG TPA: phosphomannomutase [Candidatus Margulisbacteria bacterium]|nr:MAG: hypothetical protein A2X43_00550 [Candidatus Margulisbacteria bacterium GWD2_39_127]OGI04658.1 MAG: hypothetical protein A2X42_08145 [Candidatus Margulisbacteria bacterium GWF2_38_17]HAR62728.1 phosphomannomutase [Candidatus Margulisiibacteriota bacterium]
MVVDNQKITSLLNNKHFWKVQEMLVSEKNALKDQQEIAAIQARIDEVFTLIKKQAETNSMPAKLTFGTSGWRSIIGEDYTVSNVERVTQAVVDMMKTDEFLKEIGVTSFEDVQSMGGLLGFDSRFMGHEFATVAAQVLAGNGIKIYYAGMATTPELSAAVVELKCAFSINLTPSHNPFQWAGYKFNPSDGGPAGPNLTEIIEQKYSLILETAKVIGDKHFAWQQVDTIDLYKQFLLKRNSVVILDDLVKKINNSDIFLAFDNVNGATRGRLERLLNGVDPRKISYLRTNTDYLFGGVKPEPSSGNMQLVMNELKLHSNKFKIGAIMDPDGDRVRVTDGVEEIEMNFFGAMVLYYLHKVKGLQGILAKSVATSNFANAVADRFGLEIRETAVGFKEFRPYLKEDAREKAIVAFEESDGITMQNHTLEKDALIGALLAIMMVIDIGKSLSEIRKEVQDFAGTYYPGRGGKEVDRSLSGLPLQEKLRLLNKYKPGKTVLVDSKEKTIKKDLTLDGYKFVFEDNSWLLIRPSGTEPKVRFYVEGRSEAEMEKLFHTAEHLLSECLSS